jgi:hypothetical protein
MPGIDGTAAPERERRCPWCSTAAPADATRCASCGASLAERDSLGEMAIPGVTEVDPAVKEAERMARWRAKNANAAKPHLLGPVGGAAGGVFGYAIGSAIDSFVLGRVPSYAPPPRPIDPSETSLRVASSLDGSNATSDPGPEPPPRPDTFEDVETMAEAAEKPLAPGQLEDPWTDLPAPSIADQIAGTEFDPWAPVDQPTPPELDPWAVAPQPDPTANSATTADPWSFEGGSWSQDPWADGGANRDGKSG